MTTIITLCFYIKNNVYDMMSFIESGRRTMKINQPMIIYTGNDTYEFIYKMRCEYGFKDKTKMIVLTMDQLYFYKYKDIIESNRKIYWPTKDPRCNTDVHIITLSKFEVVKRALYENPFNTTHFMFMDYNLLAKSPWGSLNYTSDNVYKLIDTICKNPRDKITLCVLNYWHFSDYNNLKEFYKTYHYIVVGGFYTTDTENGKKIFDKLIDYAEHVTKAGYGHGEEHLFGHIIDKYENCFNLTMGDYKDAIHNYYNITSNVEYVKYVLKSYKDKNYSQRLLKLLGDNNIKYTIDYNL